MTESEKPNLPADDRATPREGSFKVVRKITDIEGTSEEDGSPLYRREYVVKLAAPRLVRVGVRDNFLDTDHVLFKRLRMQRRNPLDEVVSYTETSIWACEEDGTPVDGAVLWLTPADLDLDLAMYSIGEI